MDLSMIQEITDKTLMKWYNEAIEMQVGRYIKAIKNEMNRRSKEE